MAEKKMTTCDAVVYMLKNWPLGFERTGAAVEREVRRILFMNQSDEYPSGNTIMRRFREKKDLFCIESTMHGQHSKYVRVGLFKVSAIIYKPSEGARVNG